ncbi:MULTISPECIES: hypothetical protein [unclassified Variovorax]|uniref:hypothetical protein n=1 Tax=unclassified Variovorax TaxID=663243 RepID=UPI0011608BB6|nr:MULTISPECIES: hypothetical protein [unclassified Variovorax]
MHESTASFERSLLCDPDVKFGVKHYALLRSIGAFVEQLKDAGAQVGQMTARQASTALKLRGWTRGQRYSRWCASHTRLAIGW